MDVYSPSHPTDQDMDVETPVYDDVPEDVALRSEATNFEPVVMPVDQIDEPPTKEKSPIIVPIEADSLNIVSSTEDTTNNNQVSSENTSIVVDEKNKPVTPKSITNEQNKPEKHTERSLVKSTKDRTNSSHRSPDRTQPASRHSTSRSTRNRSRSPKRRQSRSPEKRDSRRRSSSHSRQRHSHGRRRSRSRERNHRRSRSPSRSRRNYRDRDSRRPNRSNSGSRNRREDRSQAADSRSRWDYPQEHEKNPREKVIPTSQISVMDPVECKTGDKEEECIWFSSNEADEPGTPNISDDKPLLDQVIQPVNVSSSLFESQENMPPGIAASFLLHNRPHNSQHVDPDSVINQQMMNEVNLDRTMHTVQQSFENNRFIQNNFQPRIPNFQANFQPRNRFPIYQEFPPSVAPRRPLINQFYHGPQFNRFPVEPRPHPPLGMMNNFIPPMNVPFRGFMTQPPPLPTLPPHISSLYSAPPPPPFIQAFQSPATINPMGQPAMVPVDPQFYQVPHETFRVEESHPVTSYPHICPPESISKEIDYDRDPPNTNLLETIMTKAGLSTNSVGSFNLSQTTPSPDISPFEPAEEKSPTEQIHKLLSSAANTILTHFNEEQKTLPHESFKINNSPPPPPPPLPISSKSQEFSSSKNKPFIPPPLPTLSSSEPFVSATTGANPNGDSQPMKTIPTLTSQEILTKRRRSDFNSHKEWQDRIALEVRSFIKPSYAAGKITKEECREILKKSVTKISRSGCKSINTKKIGEYIKLYLQKYHKYHKWQARQKAAEQIAHVS